MENNSKTFQKKENNSKESYHCSQATIFDTNVRAANIEIYTPIRMELCMKNDFLSEANAQTLP